MNCAYHPVNQANASCHSCGRGLCPSCDHRVKGYPYCQDCIVAGIEMLRRSSQSGQSSSPARSKSPGIATLFGLIPGLGAAYNGQNIKALVHFAVTVGLWELADVFNTSLLGLAGVVFYLFSIYDARQSARRIRAGEDLSGEDERLKQALRENTHIWGSLLLGIGVLAILNTFMHHLFFFRVPGLMPLLLLVGGFFLLKHYLHRPGGDETGDWQHRVPPPSVIQQPYDNRYTGTETRRFGR
ncbi:MAG TPA: hypothetical protein VNQ79_04560 [Blastocatellia bacterium]|nr:hypothetical protein [Blastocatellia bacterium]